MAKDETTNTRFYSQEQLDELLAKTKQEAEARIAETDERFKALDDEVKNLRKVQKEAEKAEKARQEAIAAERKKAEEAQMSAKELIERRQAEFQEQLQSVQEQQAQQLAIMQREVEYSKLQAYIQRRVAEETENIAPELLDFIDGDSPEEVEASIERVKAKTAQLVESFRNARTAQRAAMPGVAPAAGVNGVTPLDQPGDRQYSDEDIANMSMAEYRDFRKKVGMSRLQAGNTGIFGM